MTERVVEIVGSAPRALPPVAGAAVGALFVWLVVGAGFVNYDTLFNLTWGDELRHGSRPQLDLALAPTQKPLVIAAGAVLGPLEHSAQGVVVAGALIALGSLAVAAWALARHFAGWPAGLLAAALVLTREPVLSFGVRAYVDLPYAALVLAALVLALGDVVPRRRVLALLVVAGLLRPEAWLFSAAYLALGMRSAPPRRRAELVGIAAIGPFVWFLSDLVLMGDPLFSLTGTRGNAELLARETGLLAAIELAPRRLGEIVREPVLLAAVGGAVLLAVRGGVDGRRLLGSLALGLAAFAALATAGLPVLGRYLLLDAILVIVVASVGLVQAMRLGAAGHRGWGGVAVAGWAVLVAFAPPQADRLERLRGTIAAQRTIASDLHALADDGHLSRCGTVRTPNHRLRPMVAAWLDVPAAAVAAGGAPTGTSVVPATRRVERLFILDPRDRVRGPTGPPLGAVQAAANASWRVFTRCGP